VRSLDLFDKPDTLASYWDSLVRGYAVEALGQPNAIATVADAKAFTEALIEARVSACRARGSASGWT
jgi:hypothetical protein